MRVITAAAAENFRGGRNSLCLAHPVHDVPTRSMMSSNVSIQRNANER